MFTEKVCKNKTHNRQHKAQQKHSGIHSFRNPQGVAGEHLGIVAGNAATQTLGSKMVQIRGQSGMS